MNAVSDDKIFVIGFGYVIPTLCFLVAYFAFISCISTLITKITPIIGLLVSIVLAIVTMYIITRRGE